MKGAVIAASEFKAKCLRMIDEVAAHGTPLIVTKRGQPVVKVIPVEPKARPFLGGWKDEGCIKGDLIDLGSEDDWTGDEENLRPPKRKKAK
jgi:prevent-host-death family protein